jgi:hypothetical protein
MWLSKPCLPAALTLLCGAATLLLARFVLQVRLEGTGWLAGIIGFGLVLSFALVTLLLLAGTVYCWRIRRQDAPVAQDKAA